MAGLHRFAVAAFVCGTILLFAGCTQIEEEREDHGEALERAITLLQIQSTSSDAAVRANCVEALQPSHDPRAMAVIEQGLHDPEWVVRFAATMAIGKRKEKNYKMTLVDLSKNDPNDSVRAAAIYALRRIGDTASMNALAGYMESPDWDVRANTALAIGLMGDPSAIPLLKSAAKESDSRVKFEITAALARLGDKGARSIIISLALSRYAEDEWNAMVVCGDLPPDIAANPLELGLADPPPQTPADVRPLTVQRQLVAARSLGKLGAPQFEAQQGAHVRTRKPAEIAVENLQNPEGPLRALAALALGEMLVPQQVGALAPLLNDSDPGVQRAAAAAIVNVYARYGQKL